MTGATIDAIQIQGISEATSMKQFWFFDGRNIGEEVEDMARRCRTVSPDAIKQQLQLARRPHTTIGKPLYAEYSRKQKHNHVRGHRNVFSPINEREKQFSKVLHRFQPPKFKNVVIGPGLILSQGKDETHARIISKELSDPELYEQPAKVKGKQRPDERDNTIEILKSQIDDLSACLEETRVKQNMHIKQISGKHNLEMKRLRDEHTEHLKAVEQDHQEDLRKFEESQNLAMDMIRDDAKRENEQLSRELTFVKAAFESYKDTLAGEMDSKWKQKELEIKLDFDRKVDQALQNQRNELTKQKNEELDTLSKEQRRQIATIVDANKKEMDILLRKFTATAADAERVQEFMLEVQKYQSENVKLKDELNTIKKLHRTAHNELSDLKVHLQMYKDNFAEKVAEVDDRYAQTINSLKIDNSTLRQQYLRKCDELYKVKSEINIKKEDEISSAKDVMQRLILTRARADVSLTAMRDDKPGQMLSKAQVEDNNNNNTPNRPLSAPSTGKETKMAIRSSAGVYSAASEKQTKITRPSTSYHRSTITPAVSFNEFSSSRVSSPRRAFSPRNNNNNKKNIEIPKASSGPKIILSPPRFR